MIFPMKNRYLLLFLLTMISGWAAAQTPWNLKGKLADSSGIAIPNASVMLLDTKDSTLIEFSTSGTNGEFSFKKLPLHAYILRVTHLSFSEYEALVNKPDLGTIRLKAKGKDLNEVIVKGEKAPVTMRHDTVEFNADSFKTRPNATVEELLKRLPGVEVESDGTVKAHGKEVQRILVDGKEFFGTDPKMATKNLAAEAIKAVQLFDRKSEQSRFSGVDDGTREKTINLELKEDFKKGIFGTGSAGYGSQHRYAGRLNLNRFAKDQQFSLVGTLNNINQQGFTMNDYFNFSSINSSGGGGMSGGGTRTTSIQGGSSSINGVPVNMGGQTSAGFVNSGSGGLNFYQQLSKKTKIDGNYLINNTNSTVDKHLDKENYLESGNYKSLQNSNTTNKNLNHRLSFNLEHQLDSVNTIRWTNTASLTNSNFQTSSLTQTYGTGGNLRNEGNRINQYAGDAYSLNSNFALRHRFAKKGRTLTANLIFGLNNDQRSGVINALNQYFDTNTADTTLQNDSQKNGKINYGLTTFYTEPLSKRSFLEANYSYQKNLNNTNREVYDIKGERSTLNNQLSNTYDNQYYYHRGGLSYRYVGNQINISTGLNVQEATLVGRFPRTETSLNRSFGNLLPNLRIRYDLANSRNLNFNYETSVNQPSLTQLQPIINNTDPLNITIGNPNLRPEYNHSFSLNYFSFNTTRFRNFFGNAFLTYTTNKISSSQSVNEQLVTTTQSVNVPNAIQGNTFIGFGSPIQRIKGMRVNANLGITYNRGISIINNAENRTNTVATTLGTRLDYRNDTKFDVNAGANLSLNQTQYSLQSAMNQNYLTQRYTLDANWNLTQTWSIGSSVNYQVLTGNNYNQKIPIWNASITKYILKNNVGEIKLSAIDLLNRNVVINRSAQVNYYQEERVTSLARYFLLTFTYSLRNKAGMGGNNRRNGPQMIRFN
ncbi:hypothetical protein QE357_002091 [Siphonobacter sp. BAB-5404]|nr:hypothetical protein [Siphonobacter sp. SORGH_AS_0500]